MIRRPKNLNSFLENLVRDKSFSDAVQLRLFQNRWEEFVGTGMRGHSYPIKYEKGRLIVVVENAIWRAELIPQNRKIVKLINESGLALRDIFYILGKPPSITQVEKKEEFPPLTPQEEKRLEEFKESALTGIHNEGLKSRLGRIREKQMRSFKT